MHEFDFHYVQLPCLLITKDIYRNGNAEGVLWIVFFVVWFHINVVSELANNGIFVHLFTHIFVFLFELMTLVYIKWKPIRQSYLEKQTFYWLSFFFLIHWKRADITFFCFFLLPLDSSFTPRTLHLLSVTRVDVFFVVGWLEFFYV